MGDQGPWDRPEVSCRNCGVRVPLTIGIIRMGAADLFVCPGCNYQEIWRNVDQPAGAGSRSGAL
jgi:predicted RNA-binding Zn-ribbon protein involved in translation (DUF1610 family)